MERGRNGEIGEWGEERKEGRGRKGDQKKKELNSSYNYKQKIIANYVRMYLHRSYYTYTYYIRM